MTVRRFVVPATTDLNGDATVYTPAIYGKLVSIYYKKTDFADGVTFAVTGEDTATAIWSEAAVNASAIRYPRAATSSTAGVASLYAAGGTAVNDKIAISGERIKAVISSGGDTKSGALHFTIDG
jgi:hypothetical protein